MSCPPFEANGGGFKAALATLGVDPARATIVNLGATLARGGTRGRISNHDESWELFFGNKALQLQMVAFEGSESAVRDAEAMFATSSSKYYLTPEMRRRVQLVHAYVKPATIADELERLNVTRRFALLKIDIDSVDLETFAAVTQRFRPRIIFVERTDWGHTEGMLFSALSAGPGQEGGPPATYSAGTNGYNYRHRFACHGTSSKMWLTFHGRFRSTTAAQAGGDGGGHEHRRGGYQVVQWDGGKNYLLVPEEDAHKFGQAEATACFGVHPAWERVNASKAISYIDKWCNVTRTPYYVEHGGVCCPAPAGSLCRCTLITSTRSYAHGGWRLPLVPEGVERGKWGFS